MILFYLCNLHLQLCKGGHPSVKSLKGFTSLLHLGYGEFLALSAKPKL